MTEDTLLLPGPDDREDAPFPPDLPFRLNRRDRVAVERHLLGLMLNHPEFSYFPLSQLETGDFARTSSAMIFGAMREAAARSIPTSSRNVHALMRAAGTLDRLGDKYFIVNIDYSADIPPARAAFRGEVDIRDLTALVLDHARVANERRGSARTALYRWFDLEGRLLYVGITDRLLSRSATHGRDSAWTLFAASSTIERLPTREDALAAERAAIKTERPIFNWLGNESVATRSRMEWYLVEVRRPDLTPFLPGNAYRIEA